jgi:hypothetical protein
MEPLPHKVIRAEPPTVGWERMCNARSMCLRRPFVFAPGQGTSDLTSVLHQPYAHENRLACGKWSIVTGSEQSSSSF